MNILLTSNWTLLHQMSGDHSSGVVLISFMIPLMYQSQGNVPHFQEVNWILSDGKCVQLGGALDGRRAPRDGFGA